MGKTGCDCNRCGDKQINDKIVGDVELKARKNVPPGSRLFPAAWALTVTMLMRNLVNARTAAAGRIIKKLPVFVLCGASIPSP